MTKHTDLEAKAIAQLGEERFKEMRAKQRRAILQRPEPVFDMPLPTKSPATNFLYKQVAILEEEAAKGNMKAVKQLTLLAQNRGIKSKYAMREPVMRRNIALLNGAEEREESNTTNTTSSSSQQRRIKRDCGC